MTDLLPSDFALTAVEKERIAARTRSFLERLPDRELYSPNVINRMNRLIEDLIEPLRMASAEVTPHKDPGELRKSAVESVTEFIDQSTPAQIDTMLAWLKADDITGLGIRLRKEIEQWLAEVPDADLLRYDRVSIKDPTFERLRTMSGLYGDPG